MQSDIDNPSTAWTQLKLGNHKSSELSVPTIPTESMTPFGPIRYALGSNREARILLPVGQYERIPEYATGTALDISEKTFTLSGGNLRFIDLICSQKSLESVFAEFAEELLERVGTGQKCIDALRTTLEDFRTLLSKSQKDAIPDSKIIGLVGELLILRSLAHLNNLADRTWLGPTGERHDFRCRDTALEIKTSIRSSDYKVHITSIDQLLPPADGQLYMAYIELESSPGTQMTVGSLSGEIESLLADSAGFLSKLKKLECKDPFSSDWNRLSFTLVKISYYLIGKGFPCITSYVFPDQKVPDGIFSAEYVIDLGYCRDFLLNHIEQKKLLGRMTQ